MKSTKRIEELSEDIDVAIQEFLERYPLTSQKQIRRAILAAERDADGLVHRTPRALALIVIFLLGVGLGATFL